MDKVGLGVTRKVVGFVIWRLNEPEKWIVSGKLLESPARLLMACVHHHDLGAWRQLASPEMEARYLRSVSQASLVPGTTASFDLKRHLNAVQQRLEKAKRKRKGA